MFRFVDYVQKTGWLAAAVEYARRALDVKQIVVNRTASILTFCVIGGLLATFAARPACGQASWSLRFASVVQVGGDQLGPLLDVRLDHLAVYACARGQCRTIPSQVDERDATGRWVLDRGPLTNVDDQPQRFDGNDVLLFMAADAGDPAPPRGLPTAPAVLEVSIGDPLDGGRRYVYVLALAHTAEPSPQTYVQYDPDTDRASGRLVTLGFAGGVPGYLAVGDGPNLLDRLKVRAAATFFFGLIHFSRSEADLRTELSGWHSGPIRVIRGQRQWVRLGWGIGSPTFASYTYFYRDSAELPVGLRLNFPPTYFFGDIRVRAILDFRDLRGWRLLLPDGSPPLSIDGTMTPAKQRMNELEDDWFAVLGPEVTFLNRIEISPSLATVRRRLLYREDAAFRDDPESAPGELPGVGFQLERWERVPSGLHWLQAVSYALPASVDVRAFVAGIRAPLEVSVRPLP